MKINNNPPSPFWLSYIMTPLGRTAVRTVRSDGDIETRYFHADGHGTIHAVTDEQGQVEQRFHYDPWGKQTEVSNSRGGNGGGRQTRGYTDHEMLNDYNLIHMNARLYDPVIARFISADRVVQDMGDSQTYNRYSYCANNPVNTTDPTGNNFVQWLYFGIDTEEIQDLLAEAYSQARQMLREKLTPGASPAPNVGAAASANGNASATGNSLLNKGSNQDQSNAIAGIQSQNNGNSANISGTASDGTERDIFKNITFEKTGAFWWKTSDKTMARAREQFKQIANSKNKNGTPTQAALNIFAINNDKNAVKIKVTESLSEGDYGANWDWKTKVTAIEYNPNYSGTIDGVHYSSGLFILTHELAGHGFDYATRSRLGIDQFIADDPVNRIRAREALEFEAVRVENSMRNSMGESLRRKYSFDWWPGALVPQYNKYAK